jgi:hypothetical protein
LRVEQLEEREVPAAVDLTTSGALGTVNGAIFHQAAAQPTGSGVIHSFVRIQGHRAVEQGYNTDARPLQFDENKSPQFTRSLPLSAVPRVDVGGQMYREFLLDINQDQAHPLLSLDELRLFVGNAPDLTGYDPATNKLAGLSAVYDLGAGGDNSITLNSNLNPGSGKGDMLAYIPDGLFGAPGAAAYVYLYSKFGANQPANGGFEEWAVGSSTLTPTGSISGVVFNDLNDNGALDGGEPGLAGWTVFLDANNNGVPDAGEVFTTTDANGAYSFTGLATGLGPFSTYRVREVVQPGWIQTTLNPADITLLAGQDVRNVNFGNFFNMFAGS